MRIRMQTPFLIRPIRPEDKERPEAKEYTGELAQATHVSMAQAVNIEDNQPLGEMIENVGTLESLTTCCEDNGWEYQVQ